MNFNDIMPYIDLALTQYYQLIVFLKFVCVLSIISLSVSIVTRISVAMNLETIKHALMVIADYLEEK